jgi:N utilization substance protein A
MRGARVKNIVRELGNEKVDIIRWYEDPKEFAREALKPAKIRSIEIDEAAHTLRIAVDKEDLALAIGKRGQNARLTARLTGWEIDIKEDRSAADAFEQQLGGAVQQLASALGISEDEAKNLAAGGMKSVAVVVTAEASDIDGILSCGPEKAEAILAAAKASLAPKSTVPQEQPAA